MARLDKSGRIRAATAVADLGWPPGTRLRADVRGRRIVLRPEPAGQAAVTAREQIVVPAAARQLAGIGESDPVLLAALPAGQILIIHPAPEIARLLRRTHARILGGRHGR